MIGSGSRDLYLRVLRSQHVFIGVVPLGRVYEATCCRFVVTFAEALAERNLILPHDFTTISAPPAMRPLKTTQKIRENIAYRLQPTSPNSSASSVARPVFGKICHTHADGLRVLDNRPFCRLVHRNRVKFGRESGDGPGLHNGAARTTERSAHVRNRQHRAPDDATLRKETPQNNGHADALNCAYRLKDQWFSTEMDIVRIKKFQKCSSETFRTSRTPK